MTAEGPFGARASGMQDTAHGATQVRSAGALPRHALNNILARIIALAEDLADHDDEGVSGRGEAVIEQAELAARLLRGEA